ncbi:hydroxyethylthiazole kinase [Rhodoferax sp. 4810]|uniref:Hydroxyethylthiazole kinase n=2 Tax=Thiospirillum jenense TaxID=1653858 RepID=A0A839HB68_9GAMM|nr:hydroxyethylthiazole kinase [Rhodoferax jenense]MBB1126275.1 hydroxyethylthiazole kinase [Thiospirillum jenense]
MQLRSTVPLIHNITNYVAMEVMANVLLATGASPAMLHAQDEVAEFAAIASALTINIGTLSPAWVNSMMIAAPAAVAAQRPWVFDPVGAGATAYRRQIAGQLAALKPSVIRGNASEILALDQRVSHSLASELGRGVDALDSVVAAEIAAQRLASQLSCVVAVTGAVDFITDGQYAARIANGHSLMTRVTALGCALTGVVAAFIAGGGNILMNTAAALAYYGLAGEYAAAQAKGPGSFAVAFIDALAAIEPATLAAEARVEWTQLAKLPN